MIQLLLLILCGVTQVMAAGNGGVHTNAMPSAQTNFWERASGYLTEGSITHLAINSSGHIFAGTNWGVYRSTDDGNTWAHVTDGIVFSLAVAPDGDVYTYYCAGLQCKLIRSSDNGDTWTVLNPPVLGDTILNAIAIRVNGNIFAGGKYSVLRSIDSGKTWTSSVVADSEEGVTALGLASGLVFAGITDGTLPNMYGTIRRSTDNGNTWSSFSPRWSGEKINGIVRNSLGYLFAATSAGIRRTTDFGATWTLTSLSLNSVSAIAINSVGDLFATTGSIFSPGSGAGIYRSTDRGDSWVQSNNVVTQMNALSLAVNSSGVLYAGTYTTGIYRSIDTALTWTLINPSLYSSAVYSLTVPSNGLLYAGTIDGIFVSSDNGLRWWPRNTGLPIPYVRTIHENSVGTLFAGLDGAGVARSTDAGISWIPVNSGISSQRTFSLASKPGGLLFAGTQTGVFRSTDNGDTWNPSGAGPASFVRSLVVSVAGNIFAGSGTGVHVSTDDGISWAPRNTGLSANPFIEAVMIDPAHDMFAGGDSGVFRSTNDGTTWFPFRNGLPSSYVNALIAGAGDSLFASTVDSGVYVSTNSGNSWTAVNSGLPALDSFFGTQCFALSPGGYLFVGTARAFDGIQAGVYRTHQQSTITQQYSILDGWNMISVPHTVNDYTRTQVFPTSASNAFAFEGLYVPYVTLENRKGYWLKFNGSQTVFVSGLPRTTDTIAVTAGWNMIGSISDTVSTASITTLPLGIVQSQYFGFNGMYLPSTQIEPGKAYWVKVGQDGKLILSAPTSNYFQRKQK